jgi:hypothetical protein
MPLPEAHEKIVLSAARDLAESADRSAANARAHAKFVEATSKIALSKLDEWERAIRNEIYTVERARPKFRLKIRPFNNQPKPLWLDLFSGSGFKREGFFRSPTPFGAPNVFLFAILLRRLNDWVPQVRAAAREATPRIAKLTDREIIVAALWHSLPQVSKWGRLHAPDKEAITQLLTLDGVPSKLADRLIKATSGPTAVVLTQAGRQSVMDDFLYPIATNAIEPMVRAKAFQILLDGRCSWLEERKWAWTDKQYCKGRYEPILGQRAITVGYPFLEILSEASKDKSAIVRRVAGDALVKKRLELGEKAVSIAKLLSVDPYPSVAERGQFVLDHSEH